MLCLDKIMPKLRPTACQTKSYRNIEWKNFWDIYFVGGVFVTSFFLMDWFVPKVEKLCVSCYSINLSSFSKIDSQVFFLFQNFQSSVIPDCRLSLMPIGLKNYTALFWYSINYPVKFHEIQAEITLYIASDGLVLKFKYSSLWRGVLPQPLS